MPYNLFEVFGVELEYMIVDRKTLAVKPVADELIMSVTGSYVADVENEDIDWSNELVNHVIELKTHQPSPALPDLTGQFSAQVKRVNALLEKHDAMLLPTGAHPLMDPLKETMIWPHENNEIYALYNRIFDCRGHGWSNLQSTHINLPFGNDEEFGRLHAAIRLLLPVIPALSASTPLLDGQFTGYADSRLETYRHNQEKIPSIAGMIIPEQAFSKSAYHDLIYKNIIRDIEPYDTEHVLHHRFLNSRGAIARFDRNAIEIRIIDIQECPGADIAILQVISETLRLLINGSFIDYSEQKKWHEKDLFEIFIEVIKYGENSRIHNLEFLEIFGIDEVVSAGDLWKFIYERHLKKKLPQESRNSLEHILTHGSLSTRITKATGSDPSAKKIREVYSRLAHCLQTNTMFIP